MAINFPNSPSLNQQYFDENTGITYNWDGSKWTTIGLELNYVSKNGDFITGPLLLYNGTNSTPALTFSSSTTSGLYYTGSGMAFTSSGQPSAFIGTNRRFGINTTSPLADLDIRNPSSSTTLRVQSDSGNRIRLTANNNGINDFYSESSIGGAATTRFFIGSTEAFRVDTSAQFGIGGSPSFKLDVISTSGINSVRSYSSASTDARFIAKNNANETIFGSDSTGSYISQTSNLPFRVITNNTENFRILGDGSVGIKTDGTTDAKLHVSGTKNSNIVHLESGFGDYDGVYLQTETLSGQSGGVKWVPNTTPGSGTTEFTTHFSNNTSGGTVQHNVRIGGNLTINARGDLRLSDSDSTHWVAFQAPSTINNNVTWTLPATDGTSGQFMVTDGAGTLSWTSNLTSIGNITGPGAVTLTATSAALNLTATGANNISLNTNGTEKLRIDSVGQIEAGSRGTAAAPTYSFTVDANTGIYSPEADQLAIVTAGTQQLTVDASGRVLLGVTTARTVNSIQPELQIEGTTLGSSSVSIICNTNDTSAGRLTLGKTRGTAFNSNTIVQSGDNLGAIFFVGANGTNLSDTGASITAVVDGTPGSGDMPTRLIFSTTSDGAGTPTERIRIDSSGNVGIGNITPTNLFDVNGNSIRVRSSRTPASATASGNAGEICWDSNYVYVCVATNTWKRAALSTW